MSNCKDSQALEYYEITDNHVSNLNDYTKGMNKGQLLMVAAMRRLIASKSSLESMSATLDLIEKQLGE
ncbi:MAG: hypothetical protein HRU18_00780 [Pseudoalteromonas sp.]|uniref:hypothetical protein n=1 Tax=Pseudoalteromonas sp. TaxID=53249 RepID=UPI001DF74C13|nr:hypothetical protein [Pseudoalteromonas sp.]NRA76714.1 hypothetical protein [Pseudoalteromonas sp.]